MTVQVKESVVNSEKYIPIICSLKKTCKNCSYDIKKGRLHDIPNPHLYAVV